VWMVRARTQLRASLGLRSHAVNSSGCNRADVSRSLNSSQRLDMIIDCTRYVTRRETDEFAHDYGYRLGTISIVGEDVYPSLRPSEVSPSRLVRRCRDETRGYRQFGYL
jgi:hypothetical protein